MISSSTTSSTSTDPPVAGLGCADATMEGQSYVGSTQGEPDDVAAFCGGDGAPDLTVLFTASQSGPWWFRVDGEHDTVLRMAGDCAEDEWVCGDVPGSGEQLLRDLEAGQQVLLTVDGYRGAEGDFTLRAVPVSTEETFCDDAIDDDVDGFVDCLDADCSDDEACAPQCPMGALGAAPFDLQLSTLGRLDQQTPDCVDDGQSRASDYSWSFIAPMAGTYVFSTEGSDFDTILSVLDGCGGAVLACNDDLDGRLQAELELELLADQEVVIVVDGYATQSGRVLLTGN